MKKELLNDALNQISDEYIYDAKFGVQSKIIKFTARKYITAAACLLLILLMIPAMIFANNRYDFLNNSSADISGSISNSESLVVSSQKDNASSSKNTNGKKTVSSKTQSIASEPEVPIVKEDYYTAEDIANIFGGIGFAYKGTATNAYKEVYVTEPKYLYIDPLPADEYLKIYHTAKKKAPDKQEFKEFLDKYFPKIAAAFGAPTPTYTIKESGLGEYREYRAEFEIGDDPITKTTITAKQNGFNNIIYHSNSSLDNSGKNNLVFDGVTVMADQTLSDAQILKSLDPLKKKLENVFDTVITDSSLKRTYHDSYYDYESWLQVDFYNSDDASLGKRIELGFNNSSITGDIIVKDKIYKTHLYFYEEREKDISDWVPIARVKKLSLKKAEEYLSKGYVFGVYNCPRCQSLQEPIDFTEYDYVDIEYVVSVKYNDDGTENVIPFYAFYKYMGKTKKGRLYYAKTYVPAIEVSGLEKYFKEKHKEHNTSSTSSTTSTASKNSKNSISGIVSQNQSGNASSTVSKINSSFVSSTAPINESSADTSTALQSKEQNTSTEASQ